jgi:general secretion pathway protein F
MSVRFRYRAVDPQGGEQRGVLTAADPRAALAQLGGRGLTVTELESAAVSVAVAVASPRRRRVREHDRILLLQEMATLLEAGVPLAEAAPSLESAYAATPLGIPLVRLRKAVQGGAPLAKAFRQAELGLPEYAHTLIESGEAAGRLHAALRDAAAQLDYERSVTQEFRSALIYPAILVSAGVLAVLAIFIIVVPRFASILGSGRAAIPAVSRWVIGTGMALQNNLLLSALAALALIGGAAVALRAPGARRLLLETMARLPVAGPWLRNSETGRWATLLGTLLANRVPLLDALALSARGLRLAGDRQNLATLRDEVRRGRALSDVLAEQGWIAPTRLNLIRVGERAGELPRMLCELGRLQTEAARVLMKRLLTLIEPIAILLIGGVIGFIMVAVILAITSLNTAGL